MIRCACSITPFACSTAAQHASVQDAVHECADAFRTEAMRQAAITAPVNQGSMHKARQACVTVALRNSCRLPTTDDLARHSLTSAAIAVGKMTAVMQNYCQAMKNRRQHLTDACACVYIRVLGACLQSSLDSFQQGIPVHRGACKPQ